MFKLPAAWLCGVRVRALEESECKVGVRYRWINKNPFNSMYFAVQAMAAELSTGALVMTAIGKKPEKISMLVMKSNATFSKKATGRITFRCVDGEKIEEALQKAERTGEGETFWMTSVGTNEEGQEVSAFEFEWTIKIKNKKQ